MPRRTRNSDFREKITRLQAGEKPRILDLFSGCGGLALGFTSAGCTSIGGIELDPSAAHSYAINFHTGANGKPSPLHTKHRDILTSSPKEILKLFQDEDPAGVDIIIGGPPCPAFTRVGRAKLREVYKHPEAYKHDPRATLYVQYLEYVKELRPLALLMENVPELLNWGGHNLGDEICDSLEQLGYTCKYTLLNATNYGVPQTRERFFLVATHRTTDSNPGFPTPQYAFKMPIGYKGTRRHALRVVQSPKGHGENQWYEPAPAVRSNGHPATTASDAISDLPLLTAHIDGTDRKGRRSLTGRLSYRTAPTTQYAQLMREWPAFQSAGYLRDHVTRCLTERDYRLFAAMDPGDDYPRAHKLANKLFEQEVLAKEAAGLSLPTGSAAYLELRSNYIPPYDPEKFPNKWRKINAKEPVRTIMAHIGKDTYSHIHYDSRQKRVISVREAARLQSFPDGFVFAGSMNAAFRQIGNSVPPLLAWALADELLHRLKATARIPVPAPSGKASSNLSLPFKSTGTS